MHAAVTVHIDAPPEKVWDVISDVRNTPRFSPRYSSPNGSTAQRVPRWARSSVAM